MDDRIGMNQASRLHIDDQSLEHETGRGDNEHNEMMAQIKRLRQETLFPGTSATQVNENHNDVNGPVLVHWVLTQAATAAAKQVAAAAAIAALIHAIGIELGNISPSLSNVGLTIVSMVEQIIHLEDVHLKAAS